MTRAKDIEVRATVKLRGDRTVPPGWVGLVDPNDDWVQRQLAAQYLVPTKPTRARRKTDPDD